MTGSSPLQASVANEGFVNGNQLYAAGKFAEAARAYEAQVKHGDYSANLFYNLGDAYYRIGSRGRAILNYRRALLLEPAHAEAIANLTFIGAGSEAKNKGGIGVDINTLCWLTSAAVWLMVSGMLVYWLSRRWRTFAALLVFAGLTAAVAGSYELWRAHGLARYGPRALIIDTEVPAHYSPADNAKVITKLPAGAEVQVLSAQGAWVYALLENGTRAWISSNGIERLIPPG